MATWPTSDRITWACCIRADQRWLPPPASANADTCIHAYVGLKRLGTGQMYLISIRDKDGKAFDGSSNYRLTVPPNPPIEAGYFPFQISDAGIGLR
jgi:hypothetical protein